MNASHQNARKELSSPDQDVNARILGSSFWLKKLQNDVLLDGQNKA